MKRVLFQCGPQRATFLAFVFHTFLLMGVCTAKNSSTTNLMSAAKNLLQWVQEAEDGFLHPALQNGLVSEKKDVNAEGGTTSSGLVHIHATYPITSGEVLVQMPTARVITAFDDTDVEDGEDLDDLNCALIEYLSNERKKGDLSTYYPFLKYLETFGRLQAPSPSMWSRDGTKLLRRIADNIPPIEPVTWIREDYLKGCSGSKDDIDVALQVIQWGHDDKMIPLVDGGLFQHRNGNWTNADVLFLFDEDLVQVLATRDIVAGEAITISHNLCASCYREKGYGTAEIFRDYGFIENYPQRWHYYDVMVQFDIDKNETHYIFEWDIPWEVVRYDESAEQIIYALREKARELSHMRYILYDNTKPKDMSDYEWETAWKFSEANILAMNMVIEVMETDTNTFAWPISKFSGDKLAHYHPLEFEADGLQYGMAACDVDSIMQFPNYHILEHVQSPYQLHYYDVNPITGDILMSLDNMVQSGSEFRPQYHEHMLHMTARFVEKVRRVAIIGGGDSMLLHEALKYPDLELVLGLELDQYVPRKCFKHFSTSPHFDDPRVEWWFGDATKSLLLLPEDYWHSFDLVLVDLSETVMSLAVTAELDVFDALALLLQPKGVLVKNDEYMEKLSTVFDYSAQTSIDVVVFCVESMCMGSNGIDFLHAPVYDHGVPTLHYQPLNGHENRLDHLHDFRMNNATVQGKCDEFVSPESTLEAMVQTRVAGIVEIIDAENVAIPLDGSLANVLQGILSARGFDTVVDPIQIGDSIFLVFQEGYLLARMWPKHKYVSLDINVWGRFDELKILVSDVLTALQSTVNSKYRVVVGGMFGSKTWLDDVDKVGPKIAQLRNCDPPSFPKAENFALSSQDFVREALLESIQTVSTASEMIVVVLCGEEDKKCATVDVLENIPKVTNVVRLSACSSLGSIEDMYTCEKFVISEWKLLMFGSKMDLLVVDESAPKEFLQVVDSLLGQRKYRKSIQANNNMAIAWSSDPENEAYRRHFLENYRRHSPTDPVSRAAIWLHAEDQDIEFGMVASGNKRCAYGFRDMEENLQKKFLEPTDSNPALFDISLEIVLGGINHRVDLNGLPAFSQSDYNNTVALNQYFHQEPLSHHVIFQLMPTMDEEAGQDFDFSSASLNAMLDAALVQVKFVCAHRSSYEDLGDGIVHTCLHPTLGSVVLSWDGRTHVDVSYYRIGTDIDSAFMEFASALELATDNQLFVMLRDEMPRGMGRVVNSKSDIRTRDEIQAFLEPLKSLDEPIRDPSVQYTV